MRHTELEKMAEQEGSHWWYQARRELLRHALFKVAGNGCRPAILDLASACGGNFPVCARYGKSFGIDISPISIEYCKRRNSATMVRGDVQRLPFADSSFDAVIAFDVFEHLPHDTDCMREVFRVLKDGRALVFNVPACAALFSAHDVVFDHFRRYGKRELRRKLELAGLSVEFMSYWSFFLFPLVYLCRKIIKLGGANRVAATSDFHHSVPRPVDWTFGLLSRLEVSLIERRMLLPWGVSLYGICRKPLSQRSAICDASTAA